MEIGRKHLIIPEISAHGIKRITARPLVIVVVIVACLIIYVGFLSYQSTPKETGGGSASLSAESTGQTSASSQAMDIYRRFDFQRKERTSLEIRESLPPSPVIAQSEKIMSLPEENFPPRSTTFLPKILVAPPPPAFPSFPQDSEEEKARRQRQQEAAYARSSMDLSSSPSLKDERAGTDEQRKELNRIRNLNLSSSGMDANAAYQAELAGISKILGTSRSDPADNVKPWEKFTPDQGSLKDRWTLKSELDPPRPFQLRAGSVIPGLMISGINSELPGQITGQASQNVYDTATGRYLLIPQGSRLVGAYSSEILHGQKSILVVWQRIIFPNGHALDLEAMPGADMAGYSGFRDQVDNHYFRTFGSALLMSAIVGGITYSQGGPAAQPSLLTPQVPPTLGQSLSKALGDQMGNAASQMLSKNINIAPTLTIRPGYRFNITVLKDLSFPHPYSRRKK